ncbi:MAG TPA: group II intron reverse transcriptase/maturase, partial [Ktedonobacterales bacterium]
VSPVLANIYLHELDLFMKALRERFDRGKRRKTNLTYYRYTEQIRRLRQQWDTLKGKEEAKQALQGVQRALKTLTHRRRHLPSGDPFDGEYRRLSYCRYADDYLIGIIGSRADAEMVKQEVQQFIQATLKLSIAEEKSHIRHSKEGTTFLGYRVKTYSGHRVVKVKRETCYITSKSVSERFQCQIPPEKLQQFCTTKRYGNYATMQSRHKAEFLELSDAEIILAYNGELRGLANYYALALNHKRDMSRLERLWKTSLFKTLAAKHKTSVTKIAERLKTKDGYALVVKEQDKTRVIPIFRLKDLRPPRPTDPELDVLPNVYIWTLSRSEVIKRLNRRQCDYCETIEGPIEVHHIRKLKDVAEGKALWQQMMAARRRKTLMLCIQCHHLLHAGKLPDREYRKQQVRGEPCAGKPASTVRRGGDG